MRSFQSRFLIPLALAGLSFGFMTGCPFRDTASLPPMDINLYSGVPQIALLGDTASIVRTRLPPDPKKKDLKDVPELAALGFSEMYDNSAETGMRIYIRRGRVALIEIQEPFHGNVRGKKLNLFSLSKPDAGTWSEMLIQQFGTPQQQASGGRLNSQAFFYPWGDISFNGQGPNEIALYRDPQLLSYRQHNFGRVVKFFDN